METVLSWMEIGWMYHPYSRCLYLIHFLLSGWCRDGEGWKWSCPGGKLAAVTILTPTVKELFALHNIVVERIVWRWKGIETVWKLAGSTILTPVLESIVPSVYYSSFSFSNSKFNPKSTGPFFLVLSTGGGGGG